ncbi:MAG: dolichol-phosphate mannosyltransferase [Deltaproteobacteria bacterium]|nr:MAG: dolichol-phosphate mannosyltransferase [Deltaproteobacteria bacterium]
MKSISIVIPVHNESENIGGLISCIRESMTAMGMDFELVVVDDGSQDNTAEVLKQIRADLPMLRILQHRMNCGQSTAIHTGVCAARGDIIVTLDGDGQNDPADIPEIVFRLKAGADENLQLVTGYRRKRRDRLWRRISSRVANGARRLILKDATPDTGCGLKAFYRETFLSLPFFDHMHRFLPALIQGLGGRVVSIEVNHLPRQHGLSHYGTWDRLWVGIVDLFGVAWIKKRMKTVEVEEI